MNELRHYKFEVPEIVFGRGLLARVGACARRLGARRVFLVSDPGLFRAGWVDRVMASLRDEGLECAYYDRVTPNPRDTEVEEGAREYQRAGADVIVGLGGGSAMDAAKGVAILASNGGRIQDYVGSDAIAKPLPPMVLCPTTCGTGADVSQFAIFNDTAARCKMTIMSRTVAPDISLTDPDALETLPDEYVRTTAFDALSHAVEAFLSLAATSLTDVHAVKALRLLSASLGSVARDRTPEHLENLCRASLHAGMAFSNALLGVAHALSHPIGGFYDASHGSVNAVLLPEVIRFALPVVEEKLPELAWALGRPAGADPAGCGAAVLDAVEELVTRSGAPRSLRSLGVAREDLAGLAERALADTCILTAPRPADAGELRGLLERVY